MTAAAGGNEARAPDADAVRAALGRILASPDFRASKRSRDFLQWVVAESLAGRGERIKAFTIAVDVLGRDATFDAQGDPAVRLEAGRLRRALELYYQGAGDEDPVEISIPKGSYQPRFALRPAASGPAAATPSPAPRRPPVRLAVLAVGALALLGAGFGGWWWTSSRDAAAVFRPSVLVVPFAARGPEPGSIDLAPGITDQIVAQLSRFREITVYGRALPAGASAAEVSTRAQDLKVSHLLDGNVRFTGTRVRVYVQLSAATNGATVWGATYDRDLRARDLFAVQDEVAAEVAMRIAQPFGDLARTPPPVPARPDDLAAYRCGLAFYAYRRSYARDDYPGVLACLEETVARYPDYATAWAMLAMARVDSDRFNFPQPAGTRSPLALAAEAARRAIALDPNDVRAWQALMLASYLSSDVAEGKAAGERALALNPNDLELVGEFGMRLAMAGDWERGTAMIRSVVDRDPGGARFHLSILAADAIRRDQYQDALDLLDRMRPVDVPTSDLLRAAALGHLGRTAEARAAGERGMQRLPGVFDRLDAEFAKRNFQADMRQALLDGWRKAGLPVPAPQGS
jgi:adenylate cyclase